MPDDPRAAVAVVFDRVAASWPRDDLIRLRAVVAAEYHDLDRAAVLDRLDDLLR